MNDISSRAASPAATNLAPAQRAQAERAAVKFEGLFISEMLKQMRRGAEELAGKDGLFKGQAGNSLLDLADTMVADTMAGQRAFGIADAILQQLLPSTPAQATAPTPGNERFKFSPPAAALEQKAL
jgi:peptidoglycan hydrolase FlgJ